MHWAGLNAHALYSGHIAQCSTTPQPALLGTVGLVDYSTAIGMKMYGWSHSLSKYTI